MDDLQELGRALSEARARLERFRHLQRNRDDAIRQLGDATDVKDELLRSLGRERQDVSRLERVSLASIVARIKSEYDDRLSAEREEAMAAELRLDECTERIRDLVNERRDLDRMISEFEDAPSRYEAVSGQLTELLVRTNHPQAEDLTALADGLGRARERYREAEEAYSAGRGAQPALDRIADGLARAKRWGTWDLLGGGIIASAGKHERLDEVRREISRAEAALRRFGREVRDLTDDAGRGVLDVAPLIRVGDVLFESFFIDLAVHAQILDAVEVVETTRRRVSAILDELSQERDRLTDAIAEIEAQRDHVLARL